MGSRGEVGRRKSEIGSGKREAGSEKLEAGSGKLGAKSWKSGVRRRKTEVGSGKREAGSEKQEAGSRKLGAKSWKSEVGSRKLEVGSVFWMIFMAITLSSCSGEQSEGAKIQERLGQSELMYFTNGKKLYTQHCANCHMENGEGLGTLIPPLKNADYLLEDIGRAARMIVNGANQPILVNGIQYVQPMPGNGTLNASEITEILTYITNSWGNEHGGITLEEVKLALKN